MPLRNYTAEITEKHTKKCAENLQVENPDIMFVVELIP